MNRSRLDLSQSSGFNPLLTICSSLICQINYNQYMSKIHNDEVFDKLERWELFIRRNADSFQKKFCNDMKLKQIWWSDSAFLVIYGYCAEKEWPIDFFLDWLEEEN